MQPFKLNVKVSNYDTIELTVNPNDIVEKIKDKLQAKRGILSNAHSLLYNDQILEDKKILIDCDIKENSTLELMKKKEGGKLNILTLGFKSVGKTAILKRFETNKFKFDTNPTIGIDFIRRIVKIGDEQVSLKLWDSAGQDQYFTVSKSMYKQCQGVLLVFDVKDRKSFDKIQKWIRDLRENADSSIIVYLLANKIDIKEREVKRDEGEKLAREHNMKYYETSARTGENVKEAIMDLTKDIYSKHYGVKIPDNVKLKVSSLKPRKNQCC